jgi:hypothetical protein
MSARVIAEGVLLEDAFGGVDVAPDFTWVRLRAHQLVPGWNRSATPVLVEIPTGYPTTPPDNFYSAADLRLANGAMPGNTSGVRVIDGAEVLQFSYHVETADWRADADLARSDTLVTYFGGVLDRLADVS